MIRFLALVCCISLPLWSQAQDFFTISGKVQDQENGEVLIGATVFSPANALGATTNDYGFYSLSLPPGDSVLIEYSFIGFQTREIRLQLDKNIHLDVELSSGVQLDEVTVKANSFQDQLRSTEMSVDVLTTKEVKAIPALLGETDILKTIQLKPGIPSGSEGTTGLFVRGGASDQNLIELDEALVYNPNHLFGFFSTFNTDAVKDLKLFKGGFPAQYGGRLSSVIDVKLKEGNSKHLAGSGGIGLISSRLTLEGPIKKDDASFIVSGRRTYVDIFTRAINRAQADNPDYNPIPDYFFYDLNTKINFKAGEKDRIFLSGYFGRDVFGFDGDFFNFDFDWGNSTGTVRWNHEFSPKIFSNTTFTYSDYQYNIQNALTGFRFNLGSNIRDANFKSDFYYAASNRHTFQFGLQLTHHDFTVGRLRAGSTDGVVSFSSGQNFSGWEWGAYISDEWTIIPRLKVNAGLRLSGFYTGQTSYWGLEPRFASSLSLSDRWSLKASYARMNQYLHLVANAGVTLPTDIWYPSTANVKPQHSDQVAAGFSHLLGGQYFLTIEGYYKKLYNQLEFVDAAQLFVNDDLEQEFAVGKGRGYGLEISIEKKEGNLSGWIGYTLAFTERGEFRTLDPNGKFAQTGYFSPIYDRRHDISVVAIYDISRRLSATATFVYGSGDLRWLPVSRWTFQDVYGGSLQPVVPDYPERNNYRLPPFHRLDLGLVWRFFPKWGESDLTLSVINAYDRRNTFFLYFEPSFRKLVMGDIVIEVPDRIAARQVSLFPILPSITWNFKF
ncbi:MAG TPA: TonB-dependent receptor [Flavilitoribacter sp.]|nr:TonB-dependent receptor [Flavilitoribacter sp.]